MQLQLWKVKCIVYYYCIFSIDFRDFLLEDFLCPIWVFSMGLQISGDFRSWDFLLGIFIYNHVNELIISQIVYVYLQIRVYKLMEIEFKFKLDVFCSCFSILFWNTKDGLTYNAWMHRYIFVITKLY